MIRGWAASRFSLPACVGVLVLGIFGCEPGGGSADDEGRSTIGVRSPWSRAATTPPRPEEAPGQVLLKLASDADAIELGRSRRGAAGTLLHARRAELQNVFARFGVGHAEPLGVKPSGATDPRFRLKASTGDTDALIEALRRSPGVVWAEPNRVYRLTAVAPNDPYWRSSGAWGQGYPDLWAPELIGAPTAWAHTNGAGVVVAVVDSGVDYGHPDLTANVWQNAGELGTDALGRDKRFNGVDDDGNGFVDDWRGYNFASAGSALAPNDPMDDVGHGTHVAGTVAAVAGNGLGIVGVAPGASVMAVKAFRQDGTALESDLIAAISYAARNGARVINASWGLLSSEPDRAMIDAVDEAHDTYGAVVVAAAGNTAVDLGRQGALGDGFYPAAAQSAIAVGATTHLDEHAVFSNFGAKIDVVAPGGGENDLGLVRPDRSILSLLSSKAGPGLTSFGQLVVGGQYLRQAGTSMAAPHVSATAALVLAAHPEATAEEVRQAIRAGSIDVGPAGWDAIMGYGRLDAGRSVSIAAPLSAHLTGPMASLNGLDQVAVTGAAAGPSFSRYRVEYGAGQAPATWKAIAVSTTPVADGTLATWDLRSVANGLYTLRLVSESATGAAYEDRLQIAVQNVAIEEPAPEEHAMFSPGQILAISGFADTPDFLSFDVTVDGQTTGPVSGAAVTVINGGAVPVEHGTLALLDTTGLPTDHYTITLAVSAADGTTRLAQGSLIIDGALHAGWPWRGGELGGAPLEAGDLSFGLVAADLDGDSAAEILARQGPLVYALRHDGTVAPGWPTAIDDPNPVALGPVAADITGDGSPEVLATSASGAVHAWRSDGSVLLGWPQVLGPGPQALALADLDRDGVLDIVAVTWGGSGITAVDHATNVLPGWPRMLDRPLGKPAVGDLDGDGAKEVVVPAADGSLVYVLQADGGTRAGWPKVLSTAALTAPERYPAVPALADIDGDGKADIVAGSVDGKVIAWRGDGSVIPGWPRPTGGPRVSSPAIGDLDGDGRVEIVVGTSPVSDNGAIVDTLHAWHADGTPVTGWPIRVTGSLVAGGFGFGAPVLADVDGDGRPDVVATGDATTLAHSLHAFRASGQEVAGFPRPSPGPGAGPTDAPLVADLDGDGLLELAWFGAYDDRTAPGPLGQIAVYDLAAPKTGAQPWPMLGHDAGQAAYVAPSASVPPPQLVALSRAGWRATGSNATGTAAAFDGDAASRWSTGTAQRGGQFLQIDLGAPRTFSRITLDSHGTPGNYPRAFEVYASADGQSWGTAIASGAGTGDITTIEFPAQTARHLRVVQTGTASNWWSIYEINIYGPPPPPVSLARTGWRANANPKAGTAPNAVDGSLATRWTTGSPQTGGEWFSIDLGAQKLVSLLTLDAGSAKEDYPRGFVVQVSEDGLQWGPPVATDAGAKSLTSVAFAAVTARHIRVTQTGAASKWWSISEVTVGGPASPPPLPTTLPRTGWSVKASPSPATASAAVDGSPATRWTTGAPQAKGQYFQVDLGAVRTFSQVTLDASRSPGDFPRTYQVVVSNDGKAWSGPIAAGYGSPTQTNITFAPQNARFARIVDTGTSTTWWSIHELNVWR